MLSEKGEVNDELEAIVRLRFSSGPEIDFIVDTGFTGALMLPQSKTEELRLQMLASEDVYLAQGKILMDAALGKIFWFGNEEEVHILISDDQYALLGSELLGKTKLEINYPTKEVLITL